MALFLNNPLLLTTFIFSFQYAYLEIMTQVREINEDSDRRTPKRFTRIKKLANSKVVTVSLAIFYILRNLLDFSIFDFHS